MLDNKKKSSSTYHLFQKFFFYSYLNKNKRFLYADKKNQKSVDAPRPMKKIFVFPPDTDKIPETWAFFHDVLHIARKLGMRFRKKNDRIS